MCGLIAILGRPNSKNTNKILLDQYENQASRGKNGFGLIEINKTELNIKRSMSEPRAMLDMASASAKILLLHHRFPTSTPNLHDQTHPILVSNKELKHDWLVMHNGVINNDSDLKIIHENIGYSYNTEMEELYQYSGFKYTQFNDSEAFAIELVRFLEKKNEIIGTQGSAAFIATKINKISGKAISVIVGRNDKNPLDMELTDDGILIASNINGNKKVEIPAFIAFEALIKDLTSNTKFEKLTELMPLVFAKIPEPTKPTMGFGAHNNNTYSRWGETLPTLPKKINLKEEGVNDLPIEEYEGPPTEKEEAFYVMQDRIIGDIEEEIAMLMTELSVEDLDIEVIRQYTDRITETIIGLKERTAKCRNYFDKKVDKEIEDYKQGKLIPTCYGNEFDNF